MKFGVKLHNYNFIFVFILVSNLIGIFKVAKAQLPPLPQKPLTGEPTEITPKEEEIFPGVEVSPLESDPEVEPTPRPEQWRSLKLIRTFSGLQSTPKAIIFSPDGKHLISGGGFSDPYMRIWSMTTGKKLSQIKAQRTAVQALAMTPDGLTLLSAGEDGGLNAWDWPSGNYVGISLEHQGQIMALGISPDGRVLVSAGLDGLRVWTLQPRRRLYQLAGLGNPSYAVAISPNGRLVASGGLDGLVRFWDLRQGTLISQFYPHQEDIRGLIFTPDGQHLITSSSDATIKIWSLETGELIHTLSGHSTAVRSMALNPDGRTLASASNDGVRIWDIQRGLLINRITKHFDWVESLAFSPDGRYLATGGFDFNINIWERFPTPILPEGTSRFEQLFEQEFEY